MRGFVGSEDEAGYRRVRILSPERRPSLYERYCAPCTKRTAFARSPWRLWLGAAALILASGAAVVAWPRPIAMCAHHATATLEWSSATASPTVKVPISLMSEAYWSATGDVLIEIYVHTKRAAPHDVLLGQIQLNAVRFYARHRATFTAHLEPPREVSAGQIGAAWAELVDKCGPSLSAENRTWTMDVHGRVRVLRQEVSAWDKVEVSCGRLPGAARPRPLPPGCRIAEAGALQQTELQEKLSHDRKAAFPEDGAGWSCIRLMCSAGDLECRRDPCMSEMKEG